MINDDRYGNIYTKFHSSPILLLGGQMVVIAPTNFTVESENLFNQLNDSWRCMFLEDSIQKVWNVTDDTFVT